MPNVDDDQHDWLLKKHTTQIRDKKKAIVQFITRVIDTFVVNKYILFNFTK